MKKLDESDILSLLPQSIVNDPQFSAAAEAITACLGTISRSIPNLLLYARLGHQDPSRMLAPLRRLTEARPGLRELDLETIESLAWQFHVDFREVAKTKEQLTAMVVNAIPWHRIKGTPEGIKAALKLYGIEATIEEEHIHEQFWATWQLGISGIANRDAIKNAVLIAEEMSPVRSKLWRMFNAKYDWRPGVWSGGAPEYAWSEFWWSLYSGVPVPGIPGVDEDHPLIVSFGDSWLAQSTPYIGAMRAAWGMLQRHAFRVPYVDRAFWSWSNWGDRFPVNSSFIVADLLSLLCADRIFEGSRWTGDWDEKIWGSHHIGRQRAPWTMGHYGWSKSHQVYSEHWADAENCGGKWGDINACYSLPVWYYLDGETPYWSRYKWSDEGNRAKQLLILEQFKNDLLLQAQRESLLAGSTCARTDSLTSLGVYPDHPIWGRFVYSDSFPRLHGFCRADLTALLAGVRLYDLNAPWAGEWDDRPWAQLLGYERAQEDFRLGIREWSKSQLVYAEPHTDGSKYGDINSNYSRPAYVEYPAPQKYSVFKYSDGTGAPKIVAIDEQREEKSLHQTAQESISEDVMCAREDILAQPGVYPDHPVWGRFVYSESYPLQHGFSGAEFLPCLADHTHDEFVFGLQSATKSQLVYAEPHTDGSKYGDINSCYSRPFLRTYTEIPKYSNFVYSEDAPIVEETIIEEQFYKSVAFICEKTVHEHPASAVVYGRAAQTEQPDNDFWKDSWDARLWSGWYGYTNITEDEFTHNLHYILHVLASGVTNVPDDLPISNWPDLHAILHGLMEGVTLVHAFEDTELKKILDFAQGCTKIPDDVFGGVDDRTDRKH